MQKPRFIIEFEPGIEEKLRCFTKPVQKRITSAIYEKLTMAPLEFGKPLRHEWASHRRLRVGDYRVIYKVIEEKVIVFIVEIDHRKDVY